MSQTTAQPTSTDDSFLDDALPTHYRDDERRLCPCSGTVPDAPGRCPNGCSGASEHYANDGHTGCADEIESGR